MSAAWRHVVRVKILAGLVVGKRKGAVVRKGSESEQTRSSQSRSIASSFCCIIACAVFLFCSVCPLLERYHR